jgi:hypothetical protein
MGVTSSVATVTQLRLKWGDRKNLTATVRNGP